MRCASEIRGFQASNQRVSCSIGSSVVVVWDSKNKSQSVSQSLDREDNERLASGVSHSFGGAGD